MQLQSTLVAYRNDVYLIPLYSILILLDDLCACGLVTKFRVATRNLVYKSDNAILLTKRAL